MKYLKNPETNQIVKSNEFGSYFDSWVELTQDEIDAYELEEAKTAKIAQIKINRNTSLTKSYITCKAYEWVEDGKLGQDEVYFEFSVESTGIQLTEPNTIIFGALMGNTIKYSCNIIEGENKRKGYIVLDQAVAQAVTSPLADRGTTYVAYANAKESEINACTTLEEVEAIDIAFA